MLEVCVRAQQRRLLLDNVPPGTFPQQRIGLWKTQLCYEIKTRFRSNGQARNNRGNIGGRDLYSVRPEVIKRGQVIVS
jgi:hypothetical protein